MGSRSVMAVVPGAIIRSCVGGCVSVRVRMPVRPVGGVGMAASLVELRMVVTTEVRMAVEELEPLEQMKMALRTEAQTSGENGGQGEAAQHGGSRAVSDARHHHLGATTLSA